MKSLDKFEIPIDIFKGNHHNEVLANCIDNNNFKELKHRYTIAPLSKYVNKLNMFIKSIKRGMKRDREKERVTSNVNSLYLIPL